ncbi:thiol reductant ABC exporter subunit CydC [Komagataeibacter xylinus]|uniref:Thiol reductant ABC exporter subunit CydC n=1 Tax=Komagataeibacter xylinus TaxID=28448 RepID=A0A318PKB3_KOMXY|nr:thiol reductant ABC exporter subunit CydC [Komagataeibacter xylinus]PYD57680.1 thiol reductant ABC exporter subunit CydC [Komagataeibacter xylinus]GBQ74533.1 transport ATP-binding protein CydD [Komagataeibacter xylinus NBRC 15237]
MKSSQTRELNRQAQREGVLAPVGRILQIWQRRAPLLTAGALLSLLALIIGLVLMREAGIRVAAMTMGMIVVTTGALRIFGSARVILRYAERLVAHDAMFRALADVRVWFFRHLARGAAAGLGFRRAGDLLSRLVSDVETLDGLYLRIILPLAGACLVLPFLFIAINMVSSVLAVVVCALFACGAFVLPLCAAMLGRREGGLVNHEAAQLRVGVLDMVGGLREIATFGAEGRMLDHVRDRDAALCRAQMKQARMLALAGAASYLCGQAAVVAVLAAALGLGLPRIAPLPAAAVLFLTVAAFESIGGLTRAGALAGNITRAAARVVAVGDLPEHAPPEGTQPAPEGTDIRFEQVSFRWDAARAPVLDHLDLSIPAGQRIAVMGPSGAGKSTLAALLLKVVGPQAGRITLGGEDIATIRDGAMRERIAWLSQATHLFTDTIRANLLLGRPDATEADLWAALEQARVADVVRELPDGLDSWLGEGGASVSGGQGRRLALARVLLSHAPILILDEPATGLDAQTEREFLLTLNEVTQGRTVILIVHRLTGVEKLDQAWRIVGGKTVAATA